MSSPRVGVIGCGIAGPVLATFLKLKGYEPVIYERYGSPADFGLAIGLQRNGFLVLSKIPGLVDAIRKVGFSIDEIHFYSTVEEDKGSLGTSDHPRKSGEADGLGMMTIQRATLQYKLTEFAVNAGVQIYWGHNLVSLEQDGDSVTTTFENGATDSFSFVLGCDGLHSQTRTCLFGGHPAEYSGLCCWGGLSPVSNTFRDKHIGLDVYGNGAHMIVAPVSNSRMMWALTQREPESRESWKAIDNIAADHFKQSMFSEWDFGAGEAIKTSTKVFKYGIYLRPELPAWHKGRVVLVGDAAHPFSPNIGQGANQALEDIDLLIYLLEQYNPNAGSPSTSTLDSIFTKLCETRAPRISDLLVRSKAQGETRVVHGVEACIERNNFYREACKSGRVAAARMGA